MAAIELLAADGPDTERAEALMLFGQFVGSWDIDARYFDEDGNVTSEREAEWHFAWVLEGRAVQDVLTGPPLAERRRTGAPAREYGSTMRVYDPRIDAWHVTWFAPVRGDAVHLTARAAGDEIVLEGRDDDGDLNRWVFSEITPSTFRWTGYVSKDGGDTWFLVEEMRARRRSA